MRQHRALAKALAQLETEYSVAPFSHHKILGSSLLRYWQGFFRGRVRARACKGTSRSQGPFKTPWSPWMWSRPGRQYRAVDFRLACHDNPRLVARRRPCKIPFSACKALKLYKHPSSSLPDRASDLQRLCETLSCLLALLTGLVTPEWLQHIFLGCRSRSAGWLGGADPQLSVSRFTRCADCLEAEGEFIDWLDRK